MEKMEKLENFGRREERRISGRGTRLAVPGRTRSSGNVGRDNGGRKGREPRVARKYRLCTAAGASCMKGDDDFHCCLLVMRSHAVGFKSGLA
jgi:hypothetical protein